MTVTIMLVNFSWIFLKKKLKKNSNKISIWRQLRLILVISCYPQLTSGCNCLFTNAGINTQIEAGK